MPIITIDLWEGRDKEKKRKLIQSVSKATAESLEISESHVQVVLNEVSKDNWGMNGEQASQIV